LDVPATFQNTSYRRLACRSASAFAAMDATNVGFISFDNPAHHAAVILHKLADFVTHAVSALVSHTKLAFQFLCRHAIFGTGHKEQSKEPLFQGRFGLVENCASGRGNLSATPSASVGASALDGMKAIRLAALALAAIRPASLENEIQAGAVIGELRVELFNRVFRCHA